MSRNVIMDSGSDTRNIYRETKINVNLLQGLKNFKSNDMKPLKFSLTVYFIFHKSQ